MELKEEIPVIRERLIRLIEIMEKENEHNWIRGVRSVLNSITDVSSKNLEQAYDDARSIYRSMEAGNGSFSDYYIHRDDFAERVRANSEIGLIKDELWTLFS